MMLLNSIGYILNVYNGVGKDVFKMARSTDYYSLMGWGEMISYITILFPFIVSFPVAFVSFDEELGKSSVFGILRCSYSLYYISKALMAFFTGCIIIWIPFGLNILWNTITFRTNMNGYEGMIYSQTYFENSGVAFEQFYKLHPLGYEVLFTIMLGFFAGICSFFAYSVSNYIKNYKIICAIPVFALFFATRALDFKGVIFDDYIACPLGESCLPNMFFVELIMLVISCILLCKYVKKREFI